MQAIFYTCVSIGSDAPPDSFISHRPVKKTAQPGCLDTVHVTQARLSESYTISAAQYGSKERRTTIKGFPEGPL